MSRTFSLSSASLIGLPVRVGGATWLPEELESAMMNAAARLIVCKILRQSAEGCVRVQGCFNGRNLEEALKLVLFLAAESLDQRHIKKVYDGLRHFMTTANAFSVAEAGLGWTNGWGKHVK